MSAVAAAAVAAGKCARARSVSRRLLPPVPAPSEVRVVFCRQKHRRLFFSGILLVQKKKKYPNELVVRASARAPVPVSITDKWDSAPAKKFLLYTRRECERRVAAGPFCYDVLCEKQTDGVVGNVHEACVTFPTRVALTFVDHLPVGTTPTCSCVANDRNNGFFLFSFAVPRTRWRRFIPAKKVHRSGFFWIKYGPFRHALLARLGRPAGIVTTRLF